MLSSIAYSKAWSILADWHWQLLALTKKDPNAQEIAKHFDDREKDHRAIRSDLEKSLGDVFRKLADPKSGLFAQFQQYWERRLPPNQQRSSWSIDQIITALDDEKFTKQLQASGEVPPVEKSLGAKIKDNLVGGTRSLLQGLMHSAAIGLSVFALVEGGKQLHALELTQISICLATEGLSLVGSAARRLITWGIARVKGWTRTISWFLSVTAEGVTSLGKRSVDSMS